MSDERKRICLAQIGAAHGIKGHVRVKPFTEDPEGLANYGKLETETGDRSFKIAGLRAIKGGMLVVKFKGVNDRNEAEALNGVKLFIDRDLLPDLNDDDDFYIEDLIGLAVADTDGNALGTVLNIHNFGAGDLLDVKPPRGPSLLVPFTKAAVPDVSLTERLVTVDRELAGLLDEKDESLS